MKEFIDGGFTPELPFPEGRKPDRLESLFQRYFETETEQIRQAHKRRWWLTHTNQKGSA